MNHRFLITSCVGLLISGCATKLQQLSEVVEPPALTHIQNPTSLPTYQPIDMPMPTEIQPEVNANSLWQPGSKSFFKDMRASRLGDIITVKVEIAGEKVTMKRHADHTVSKAKTPGILADAISQGMVSKAQKLGLGPNQIAGMTGATPKATGPSATPTIPEFDATGNIGNTFDSSLILPCTIVQVLGNGHMVLHGRQEYRAEQEIRVVEIKGIIRREDVEADNTVSSNKMAEARISYGGHGEISNALTQPYGHKLIKALAPF